MIFGKWKKRAYEMFYENMHLEEALIQQKEKVYKLSETLKLMDEDPTCKQILGLRFEALQDNRHPTKVYLTPEQEMNILNNIHPSDLYSNGGARGLAVVYGLEVHTTQYNMRVT